MSVTRFPTYATFALTSLSVAACWNPHSLFDPQEATLTELRSQVKAGTISCRTVVERYQDVRDSVEPKIHSMVTWNPRLLSDADRLDRIAVWQRGSFHCVPIVVKDNTDVAGLPTTAGAQALAVSTPTAHADVVQRLVDEGAIVLGKTNMPDFALDGTHTVSSFGGQTVNPYNQSLTVYGSSGGTAAAIAASLGVLGIGTDTYGSLVQPASATGLVAIRPTQGLVSSKGILPLMTQQDVAGPMARSVEDAASVLALLVDKTQSGKGSQDYSKALNLDGLRFLHVGYDPLALQAVKDLGWIPSPEVAALFNQSLSQLTLAGAMTKQVSALLPLFASLQAAADLSFACMPVDFKGGVNGYLGALGPNAPIKSLADIVSSGKFLSSAQAFVQGAQAQTDTVQTSLACQQYLAAKEVAAAAVTKLMDTQELDVLVYPAANQPAFPAAQKPPAGWFGFQILSSMTGMPSLSMTMGVEPESEAPVGLIFLARKYQEAELIQAAFGLQMQAHARVAPSIGK